MRTLLLSASLLVAAVPMAAEAADTVHVNREGYKLEYTVTPQADGAQLITGHDLDSREPFTLRVKGQEVSGDVDGRQVSFRVPKKTAAALVQEVAAAN